MENLQDSIDFYINVLGFTLRERMWVEIPPLEEITYLNLGDTVIELMKVAGAVPPSADPWPLGYRMMALEVEDMERVVGYLKGKGVGITWGPINLGSGKGPKYRMRKATPSNCASGGMVQEPGQASGTPPARFLAAMWCRLVRRVGLAGLTAGASLLGPGLRVAA